MEMCFSPVGQEREVCELARPAHLLFCFPFVTESYTEIRADPLQRVPVGRGMNRDWYDSLTLSKEVLQIPSIL